jgi:hypothetical protein
MKILISISIIIAFNNICICQNSAFYPGGGHVFSLGGITSTQEGITAVYHNPAATSYFEKSISFDVSADRRFINNFINPSIAVLKKMGKSNFGLGYYQYGISEYKVSNIFLSYARTLFRNLSLGTRFNYQKLTIQNYGSSNLLSIDFGIHSRITKSVTMSAYFDGIASSIINEAYKKENRIVFGIDYHPSKKVHLITEFEKNETDDLSPKLGIRYMPIEELEFRTGVDLQREIFSFGFLYHINAIGISAGQSLHNQLGNIFALSINGEK